MSERHVARLATLAFVTCGDDVLLLRHPPHADRFAGLWNGIGGHVEAGEDVRAAARRELREEAGLDVPGLRLRAVVHESGMLGHAYVVFFFSGRSAARRLHPAPGLELAWHPSAGLSEIALVPDLPQLLPRVLAPGEPGFAVERYDGGSGLRSVAFSEDPT
jgi:8-oxo-dGTP diphosphatase